MKLIGCFLVAVFVLGGCASRDTIHHYLLPIEKAYPGNDNIQLELVLADYLKRSSLAVVDANNQVFFAHQHRWAEPLESAMHTRIRGQLNKQLAQKSYNGKIQAVKFNVKVLRFHGTVSGNIVFMGLWSIEGRETQAFNFTRMQLKPGYPELIAGMNELINQLVSQMANHWQATNELVKE